MSPIEENNMTHFICYFISFKLKRKGMEHFKMSFNKYISYSDTILTRAFNAIKSG